MLVHPSKGSTAFVVVAPDGQLTEVELIAWARERLAHYKVPRRVTFAAELPRTATGKVQKNVLRQGHVSIGANPGSARAIARR